MAPELNIPDDEIDIRELVHTLFRHKWFILGITLAAAVIVFVYSKFIQPRIYSAQAQVIITKPSYITNLETSIQIVPQIPEGPVLRELAMADDLLWSVYMSSTAVLDEGFGFDQFIASLTTKLSGTSKLILSVSASKPETSAVIVNAWAEQFAARVNSIYSVNERAESTIAEEAKKAFQKWDDTEQVLLEKNPGGSVEIWKVELAKNSNSLAVYLDKITQWDLLVSDTQSLQRRLAALPAESPLSIEYRLSLIGLYQRAAGGLGGIQVQLTEPTTTGLGTVAEAKASLEALLASLDKQKIELQESTNQLKQAITEATLKLEAAEYQLTQLTNESDLALSAYQALSAQLIETGIDLARADLTAKIASQGVTPQQAASNRTLIRTMIAGILAFVIACFGVLLVNWWKTPLPA